MMRQYELVERVKSYNPAADEDLLNRAYVYAMKAHGSQTRDEGGPYFAHPLEVAAILTELRLDDATIVAAVLHDTVEDTSATVDEINTIFGPEIGQLVDGLTKLKRLDLASTKAKQGENFRKLLLAVAADIRVLLVKLADRLHNMRTLRHVKPDKQVRIATETLEIYAPLAGRIGMQELREELEELSFRYINPDAHGLISTRLATLNLEKGPLIAGIEGELKALLGARGLQAQVKGRSKRPYSVWRKMQQKSLSFEQLSDIFGFRVIVGTVPECYQVLGMVHTTWPMVPGRYKDYLSLPKQNGYRSLHTTVVGPGHQRVELQIRTHSMDRVAEYGIAAHTLYKDLSEQPTLFQPSDKAPDPADSDAYQNLRQLITNLAESTNPEEFLENTKLELFQDQVFCFTPKGRLIALPRGATAIDFAYAVHTDVGNTASACRINGRHAPLSTELRNGEEVAIVREPGRVPPPAWETVAVTGKARLAIRRATRAAIRTQYAGLGRQILDRTAERLGRPFSEDKIKAALPRLARGSVEDVLAAVGRGEMYSGDVIGAIYPDMVIEKRPLTEGAKGPGWFDLKQGENLKFRLPEGGPSAIPVRSGGNLPVRFASGGGAVPGDRIVGIFSAGEGITVYPIQSPALAAFDHEPERWLDVRWDIEQQRTQRYPARIALKSINEPGTLAQITRVIAEHDGNIEDLRMQRPTADFTELTVDLSVWDLKHLNAIIGELRQMPIVNLVERVVA